MRQHLVLYINGRRHEIFGVEAGLTLTDYLRQRLRLTGTKVVCAEGDCGSCTVSIGRVRGGTLAYSTVCGCILRLYQLDACHIVTIEGLKYDGRLNPLQEAMVSCHGAQCGYCTPGFVVSLHAALAEDSDGGDQAIRQSIAGNLCRCTGYAPILEAARRCDVAQVRPLDQLYPSPDLFAALAPLAAEPMEITADALHVFKPTTVDEAIAFRAAHPGCVIMAGGTDLGVVMNKRRFSAAVLMATSAISELEEIDSRPDALVIGANVTHARAQAALAERAPEFARYLEIFGSPQIRHAGTVAGNLATGSPIGDSLPPLCVLEATIELAGPRGRRSVNINDFYTGYRATVMSADEMITRVTIPLPQPGDLFKLYKVSRRRDLDISTFTAAAWVQVRNDTISAIRLAMGGVAPTVARLRNTEAQLVGQPMIAESFTRVRATILSEISPISDVRGSADYRKLLAGNIFVRMLVELSMQNTEGEAQ